MRSSPLPRAAAALDDAPVTLAEVEQFLYCEARLLDERRLEEWRALFTEDGLYWAPTRPGQKTPEEAVSLFLDDPLTMGARIRRLGHPDVHVQTPPSHTTHLVSNIELAPTDAAGEITVFAAFAMAEYRHTEPHWYAGRYEYRLRRIDGALRIALKKVMLVNASAAFTTISIYP